MKAAPMYLTIIESPISTAQTFALRSDDLQDPFNNKHVYNGSHCTGDNLSPELSWDNPPKGTKSFAVVMHDPDSHKEGGWAHWLLFDIPLETRELHTGAGNVGAKTGFKEGIQSLNDFEGYGYDGPCPPQGVAPHRYEIAVYALKTDKLGLHQDATPSVVRSHIERNSLGKAMIVSHYGK